MSNVTKILSAAGMLSYAAIFVDVKDGEKPDWNDPGNRTLAGIGTALTSVAAGKGIADHYRAKRLRAYYGHTSKY